MLVDGNGLKVVQELTDKNINTGVIIISAKNSDIFATINFQKPSTININ